jgi:transposase
VVAGALAGLGKKAADAGRTLVWGDQSGFSLLPMAVRPWARCGQTPLLRVPLTHDHLAAIGGLTPDGRVFLQTHDQAYHAPAVVRFLRVLLRTIRGKLLIIWDGAPSHRGQPIKDFLAHGAAKRLHLEPLPGYAPELNPAEGIGNSLQRVEVGNRCCTDLSDLEGALRRAKERLRHTRHVLRACVTQCGYHV